MKYILAKHAGFCFGVKRAVRGALGLAREGKKLVSLGELIHNKEFVEYLRKEGITPIGGVEEIRPGDTVLIRSHGVPKEIYEYLDGAGIEYRDMTCPFVSRIHKRVYDEKDNYSAIIIVGFSEHPEVIGIKGWSGEKGIVVGSVEEAESLPFFESLLVVAQTTITPDFFRDVCGALQNKCSKIDIFDSICETTSDRQNETRELAEKSDAVIVIGDRHSSNSKKLYEIAKRHCPKAYFIESAKELAIEMCADCDIISVVAGASVPDWIIMEVCTLMSELEKTQVAEEAVKVEETAAEPAVQEETVQEEAAPEKPAEHGEVGEGTFAEELEKTFVRIRKGQFVKGVVVQVTDSEVCVNIGYKSDGVIKREDLSSDGSVSPADLFQPGDPIEAEVITLNDGKDNVVLSRKKIESQSKWRDFVNSLDMEALYECTVTRVIKGGVLTKFSGYDAFIPASQLSLKYVEDLNVFVGKPLVVKIIDVDKKQKRFVLSNKEALKTQIAEQEKMIFGSFEKGSVVRGVVKRLTDFGAFVDVGGVDGLLHITDISWVRIKHPKEVLSENQEIDVKILNVDSEKRKISLGYKQLQTRPWDTVPEKYHVGDVVEGKVVRIAPFGAFVELEPTVDGLVHISQVTNRRIEKVEDVLSLGQAVKAKVLEVNAEKRRISLSMRALMEAPKSSEPAEGEAPAKERRPRGGHKEEEYTLPPVEEATTSLADLFKRAEEE